MDLSYRLSQCFKVEHYRVFKPYGDEITIGLNAVTLYSTDGGGGG